MLCVGVTEILKVVRIIVLECKSVFHVLYGRYVLIIKMLQVILIW